MPRSGASTRLIDVAERAGVSIATASRSLRGQDGVSEAVAAHVRQVATDLGYVVNVHARTLAGGSTSIVGLIVHEIGDPYFSEIASGVVHLATARGLTVQICHSGRDPLTELSQIRTLLAHGTQAVLIAGSGYVDPNLQAEADRELRAFQAAGGRAAVIGRHFLRTDAVLPANVAAGDAIAEHVLSLGHRRIAVAAGAPMLTTVEDRVAGVRTACARHGLAPEDVPVVHSAFTRDGGREAAEQILDEHPGTTAVLALNDVMAIGVLSTLRARGVSVPADVSVVGIDDIAVAADLAPGLTTVRLHMTQLGELALAMALKPPSSRPRRRSSGHELVVRDSTAPPPGHRG
ncbi:LacI family DNA-binding transcriptional regulator [Motilibacter aurantiacus]|uniref:LacI family DNA-binding transcriptional regulator n=1 Tax=Motilibacter aurantiacus TaxID=2714955 RepID=UPI001409C9E1|nr:LacI family DNA-binding transcriptional regulator [Motilibacter aurantiacus]NHC46516.1 LacI family transcriptional regulator [Motilibacter aurantiacus]